MTPSAWRDGGRGETIRWATAETDLGTMLVAATDKGICRLSFDEGEAELRRRFPMATIEQGGAAMADLVRRTVARSEEHTSDLQSLMRISYAEFCLETKTTKSDKRKRTH